MAYLAPTPNLSLILPDPATIQAFETTNVNENFTKIDAGVGGVRGRLDALEPLVLAAGATPGVIPAGTAAQRDAYWGAPGTAAARVALANKMARWVDTATGVTTRYYCATADSGQAGYDAKNASATAGWKSLEWPYRPDQQASRRFPYAWQMGVTAPRVISSGSTSVDTINFATGRFPGAPLVVCSGYGGVDTDSAVRITYVARTVSATGFQLAHINPDGAAAKIGGAAWFAFHALDTNSSG